MLVCAGASYLAVGLYICRTEGYVFGVLLRAPYVFWGPLQERSALVGCKCWCGGVACEERGEMCNNN